MQEAALNASLEDRFMVPVNCDLGGRSGSLSVLDVTGVLGQQTQLGRRMDQVGWMAGVTVTVFLKGPCCAAVVVFQ